MGTEIVLPWSGTVLPWIVGLLELIAGLVAAIATIRKWVVKPMADFQEKMNQNMAAFEKKVTNTVDGLKVEHERIDTQLRTDLREFREEVKSDIGHVKEDISHMKQDLRQTGENVEDMLWKELEHAYQRFMAQKWCSSGDKKCYIELHKRYTNRGLNTLADSYEADIISLPEYPSEVLK